MEGIRISDNSDRVERPNLTRPAKLLITEYTGKVSAMHANYFLNIKELSLLMSFVLKQPAQIGEP